MGEQNLAVNQLLERKEIFADLMNGIVFEGREMVKPENLEHLPTHEGVFTEKGQGSPGVVERWGDVKMRADFGTCRVILAEETQGKVHYAMTVRIMLQEALEYTRQVQALEKRNKIEGKPSKLQGDEFLSGIRKEDRLEPVITVVLYLGRQWDGSTSMFEMFGLEQQSEAAEFLTNYIQNYRINVVSASNMQEPERFRSCLQYIFSMLKYNSDKQKLYQYVHAHGKELEQMDGVEKRAAVVMLGGQKKLERLLKREGKGEEPVMWEALDELYEDGRTEGKREGKIEGKIEGKRESILLLLGELDTVPENVKKSVCAETNIILLGKWLKLAAKSDSMEEFLKRWEQEDE